MAIGEMCLSKDWKIMSGDNTEYKKNHKNGIFLVIDEFGAFLRIALDKRKNCWNHAQFGKELFSWVVASANIHIISIVAPYIIL